jgi:hypothetical protein
MLQFLVFVTHHPRRSFRFFPSLAPAPRHRSSNSHRIIPFADPHPLNSVVSYRYKNIGGQGLPRTFATRDVQNPVAHLLFFSTTYEMPLAQLLSFDNLPFSWGVWGSSTFQPSNLPTFQLASIYPLSFHTLPHSFAHAKIITLLFSSDSALFAKNNRGWGYPASLQTLRSSTGDLRSTSHESLPRFRARLVVSSLGAGARKSRLR